MHRKGLVIGILILMLGVNIGSSFAGDIDVKSVSSVGFYGNTLYVGGSGPNNYTTIQSAIDDASDGDTVFVYDDSSPYYENLIIEKQLNLMGEDRNTTVIDGGSHGDFIVMDIQSDNVHISGFTTQEGRGIRIDSNYCSITGNNIGPHPDSKGISLDGTGHVIQDNIVESNDDGIVVDGGSNYITNNSIRSNGLIGLYVVGDDKNIITGNIVLNHSGYGIFLQACSNSNISGNVISYNNDGLFLQESDNTYISNNVVTSNDYTGIYFWVDSNDNIVIKNIISHNRRGISFFVTPFLSFDILSNTFRNNDIHNNSVNGIYIGNNMNIIENNNFRDNGKNAEFSGGIINTWDGNYWGESIEEPYVIYGRIGLLIFKLIPWFNFDWNPAQEPYDIGV